MEPNQTETTPGPSRRRILGLGAATAGAAWITPAIISSPAASAATDPPPPGNGMIAGIVSVCGHALDQGDSFLVTATQNPGGFVGADGTDPAGAYAIAGLPPGTYDITLQPTGAIAGWPSESFPGAAVVTGGATATFSPDYQANGC